MMRKLLTALCAAALPAMAEAAEPLRVKLYPEKTQQVETVDERGYITAVGTPELLVFLPAPERATGQGVLVVPGGGYGRICVPYEGYKTAEWLNDHGIAAMVLKYRLPAGHPETVLEDGEQAMCVIRSHAARWGVDPVKIGAMGFSAGGHFVSMLATSCTDEAARPDFAVLVYPVISMELPTARSRENLLGAKSGDPRSRAEWSTHERVRPGMPEVLLVLCDDDKTVVPQHSLLFYEALKRNGIGAEMHIYPTGGHGFWMRERYEYGEETYAAVLRWIRRQNASGTGCDGKKQ